MGLRAFSSLAVVAVALATGPVAEATISLSTLLDVDQPPRERVG